MSEIVTAALAAMVESVRDSITPAIKAAARVEVREEERQRGRALAQDLYRLHQALVSGKYKQGTGVLVTVEGSQCCLGVAASEAGLTRTEIERHNQSMLVAFTGLQGEALATAFPALIKDEFLQRKLAELNDKHDAETEDYSEVIAFLSALEWWLMSR